MDYYIEGAVEEYLKHNRTVLEGLRDLGVFSQADVESELENKKLKLKRISKRIKHMQCCYSAQGMR